MNVKKKKDQNVKEKKKKKKKKRLEEELKKNPNANIDDLKKKKKKKKRKRRGRKKDDWSDSKPWTPQRILNAIHADRSPFNWGLFQPSQKELKPIKWGHGSLPALRKLD